MDSRVTPSTPPASEILHALKNKAENHGACRWRRRFKTPARPLRSNGPALIDHHRQHRRRHRPSRIENFAGPRHRHLHACGNCGHVKRLGISRRNVSLAKAAGRVWPSQLVQPRRPRPGHAHPSYCLACRRKNSLRSCRLHSTRSRGQIPHSADVRQSRSHDHRFERRPAAFPGISRQAPHRSRREGNSFRKCGIRASSSRRSRGDSRCRPHPDLPQQSADQYRPDSRRAWNPRGTSRQQGKSFRRLPHRRWQIPKRPLRQNARPARP